MIWRQALGINQANSKTFALANTETIARLPLIAQVIHINSESRKQPQKHNTKAQRLISDTYTLM